MIAEYILYSRYIGNIGSVSTNRGSEIKKSTPKLVEKYYQNSLSGKAVKALTGILPAKFYEM